MKYFTKEELEDITTNLLENPTRETLKSLNEKYNSVVEVENNLEPVNPQVELHNPTIMPLANDIQVQQPVQQVSQSIEIPNTIETLIPNANMQNVVLSQPKNSPIQTTTYAESQNIELPKLETVTMPNIQNNEPINFTGNLFEKPMPSISNLMQTTDNFNSVPNTMPTTEVPLTNAPFFGPSVEVANNPIPVTSPVNNAPVQGPSMFGQFEQSYM